MTWPTKKLGEVLQGHESGVWGSKAEDAKTSFPVLRSVNFTNKGKIDWEDLAYRKIPNDIVSKLQLKEGDVLLEKSGGSPNQPVGRVLYFERPPISKPVLFGNFIERLKIQEKFIIPKFLFFYLYWIHLLGFTRRLQMQTTGIRNLQLERYLSLKIPIPSLPIQQKIVNRLDAIKKTQELNDKQIALADELFQSLLHQELDPKGKNWEAKKLGKLINFQKGKKMISSESKTPDSEAYIGIDNLRTNTYSLYTLEKSGIRCEPNDVLLVWDGAYAGTVGIGLSGFVGSTIVKVLHSNDIDGYFLRYILERYRERIRLSAQGAAVPHLNKSFINNLKILLPSLETQQKIVEKLSAVQEYKKKLLEQKLQELFESVLNKSFKSN